VLLPSSTEQERNSFLSKQIMSRSTFISLILIVFVCCGIPLARSQEVQIRTPYVATPPDIVNAMLKLAGARKSDVVYDLGCGDGRIVITAAKKYGARGVGIDINPQRIDEANQNAKREHVANLVNFHIGDVFKSDVRPATIVALYMLSDVNVKLRPRLQHELKPGSRIVTHGFAMGNWQPTKVEEVDGEKIYLWVLPAGNKLSAAVEPVLLNRSSFK
jgi:2-polyprenyl-3-methyl-5-hydroxy-6-metoxy-1,4-benzoquinol methylase